MGGGGGGGSESVKTGEKIQSYSCISTKVR